MSPEIQTLHCLCSAFCAALPTPLDRLPKREQDGALICETSSWDSIADNHSAVFVNTQTESNPVVLKLEDGFEKRYRVRCGRCGLMVGYHLDKSQFEETKDEFGVEERILYLPPGGLKSTKEIETIGMAD